jgi:hypothetical protein
MGGVMRGGALVMVAVAIAGCGSKKQPPSDADKGNPEATKAVRVDAVRAFLDPEAVKKYDDSAVVVVRNTSEKIANGVTVELKWPQGYSTKQDEAIVLPPGERGIFLLGRFDAPPEATGQPKAEVRVDGLVAPKQSAPPVKFSGLKVSGCKASGTASNEFKRNHPGVSGLVAGLRDGKIVTAGSIFFPEPGLTPGDETKFHATLEPFCPKGGVDEVVAFAQLSEADLQDP